MSQITEIFLEFDSESEVQLYGSYWGDEENIYRYNHPTKLNSGFSLSTSGWAESIKHLGMFEIDSTLEFNKEFDTPLGEHYREVISDWFLFRKTEGKVHQKSVKLFWHLVQTDASKLKRFLCWIMLTVVNKNLKSTGMNLAHVQWAKIMEDGKG